MSVLVHAVDIGAAGLGFNEFLLWGSRVVQEFQDQWFAEENDKLGPSTSFFKYNGKVAFYKS